MAKSQSLVGLGQEWFLRVYFSITDPFDFIVARKTAVNAANDFDEIKIDNINCAALIRHVCHRFLEHKILKKDKTLFITSFLHANGIRMMVDLIHGRTYIGNVLIPHIYALATFRNTLLGLFVSKSAHRGM